MQKLEELRRRLEAVEARPAATQRSGELLEIEARTRALWRSARDVRDEAGMAAAGALLADIEKVRQGSKQPAKPEPRLRPTKPRPTVRLEPKLVTDIPTALEQIGMLKQALEPLKSDRVKLAREYLRRAEKLLQEQQERPRLGPPEAPTCK